MTTASIKKPPMSDNISGFQNHFLTHPDYTKKPPYVNQLNLSAGACLVICTGSKGWQRAKFSTWFPGAKVVLPFGEDPAAYAWSMAAGYDVMITGFGELEPIAIIASLAGLLLAAGAGLVLYAPERGPVTRINAVRREAA